MPKEMIAKDEEEVIDILLETIEGQYCNCEGQIWLKTQAERIYTNEERRIREELIVRCMKLKIKKPNKREYPMSFRTSTRIARKAIKKVKTESMNRDDKFKEDMIANTRDKIFYKNGYIRVSEKGYERVIGEDNIATPIRISRDIPEIKDRRVQTEELINKVLMPIFGTEELMTEYLQQIARAITGHIEDKEWLIIQGRRDSGKGVLTMLNDNTFGKYTDVTDNIKRRQTDEMRRWTRILTVGDIVRVRDINETVEEMEQQSRIIMMCNEIPKNKTATEIRLPTQFVTEETKNRRGQFNRNMIVGDIRIKEYVMQDEVCECYLEMVLNEYKNG